MLESYALYSTELTDEERELGFELVAVQNSEVSEQVGSIQAVAYRFSDADQIVKMNVPVIGGHSYRHERKRAGEGYGEFRWVAVGSVVFPTPEQALNSLAGAASRLQLCH